MNPFDRMRYCYSGKVIFVWNQKDVLQKILISDTFANKNMQQFSHVIFDLDGTLTDPRQGISKAIGYALSKMSIEGFDGEVPDGFIGPPLQQSFKELYSLNERNTGLAIEYFREYYSSKGLFENQPYPGIPELMEELHLAGKQLFIATSKLEMFALRIAAHFGFDRYVSGIKGADYKGEHATKTVIISNLLEMQRLVPSEKIVMVGDTVFDIVGGKMNGLTTTAVLYGFGKPEELQTAEPDFWSETVDDLYEILMA